MLDPSRCSYTDRALVHTQQPRELAVLALKLTQPPRIARADASTVAQTGVAGYAADFALVMYAPRATPEAIVTRMRLAFVDALRMPDVVETLKAGDQTVVGSTPGEAASTIAADSKKWGDVARRIGLGLD